MSTWQWFAAWTGLALCLAPAATGADKESRPPEKVPDWAKPILEPIGHLPASVQDPLNLTVEQKQQLARLEKEFRDQNREALDRLDHEAAAPPPGPVIGGEAGPYLRMRRRARQAEHLRQEAQKLQHDFEAQVPRLLTAEQKKKYAELTEPSRPDARAQEVKRNLPYATKDATKADEHQMLDVYAPANARNLPVVFWIHGGGWQTGDKAEVQLKPQAFLDKGFVFVSTNYRLWPSVEMGIIVRDVARSIRWVHDHIAEYGGDPERLFIMGHSAGAQLAALICTDERYLQAEGLSLAVIKGCVLVDGDTYDIPAIIETAETRWRVHGLPRAKFGHREKFGNDPAKFRDFSAVTHVAKGKDIPPFLILYVAGHPDTSAQALRLANVLKDAGLPATLFGAQETTHARINADLGKPDDPATKVLFGFLDKALKTEPRRPAGAPAGRSSTPAAPNPDSQYRLGPDSLAQEGVPKGVIRGPYTLPSAVYPGTQHTYWVYVPAQYDPAVPAALMVYQDGQAFKDEAGDMRAQNVMDNLIYRREIPVMIGVFINPGRRPDQPEPTPGNWGDRDTNRPTEYNTLDDRYARVITEELLPALRKEYHLSADPAMHGIGGSSSGAIAAFTVAWERPDQFRKVLSNVGSFVNLRGGHVYPERVWASARKPIRVFLCDGRNDNRGLRNGVYDEKLDWFYQNVRLMKALTEKGYDVNYAWGMNRHGQKFGGAILPEMMRWLWRDGPVSTDPNDQVERSFRQPAEKRE